MTTPNSALTPAPIRVAVIDDDPACAELVRLFGEALGAWQLTVLEMADPLAAVEHLCAAPVDVVLLDLHLGRVGGLDVLRRLRAAGYAEPVVILTGTANMALANELWRSGADDFLYKQDLSPDTLGRSFRLVLGKRDADRQAASARIRAEEASRELAVVLQQLRIGVVTAGARDEVVFANAFALDLLGQERAEAVGKAWPRLCSRDPQTQQQLKAMRQVPAGQRNRVAASWTARDGRQRHVEFEIHDHPADAKGTIALAYDITDVVSLRRELAGRSQVDGMIGRSPAMLELMAGIRNLSKVDSTVVIEGETGAGKELVARALHAGSGRSHRPFVALNCAGLSESLLTSQLFGHRRGAFTGAIQDQKGFFEAADGGTLFLDEIGDVPPSVQAALLRVLQEREILRIGDTLPRKINVRVVAATHHNLGELVASGAFREDLLYRLRVARLRVPPLRERRQDIALLVQAFVQQIQAATGKQLAGFDAPAMQRLLEYAWPGNVRELKAAVEFAAISAEREWMGVRDLPSEVRVDAPSSEEWQALQRGPSRSQVVEALRAARGNKTKAAVALGVGRATLYRWLTELGLAPAVAHRQAADKRDPQGDHDAHGV